MDPQQLQQAKAIFSASLEQEPGEQRAAYLDGACGQNEELRQKVEALLAHHDKDDGFLQNPPLGRVADLLRIGDHGAAWDLTGQIIGSYSVLRRLGIGGMGEVWLAQDTKLPRQVALKFLPARQRANPLLARRLTQEARDASSLNHPNIVTIYDVGEYHGTPYIASEFVEGESLRQKLHQGPLPISTALNITGQIADGLAAAHAVSIVHRDIKPENIMVRLDDRVKVLDFGIAKRLVPEERSTKGNSSTATQPGVVTGTVRYMSPEQARGEPVDARTDLWSLGVVLYEMVAGRPPFTGSNVLDLLAAIQKQPTPVLPIKAAGQDTPKLGKIVAKLLEKDPDQRYPSTLVLLADLQSIGQPSPKAFVKLQQVIVSKTLRRWLWGATVALLLTMAAGLGLWFTHNRKEQPLRVVPLTTYPGHELWPSLSPDGNQVAFSWNGEEKQENYDIYVKPVDGSLPLRLTSNPAPDIFPAWCPDNRNIAFIRSAAARLTLRDLSPGAVYLISPLGGPERKLTDMMTNSLAWMPDGKSLLLSVQNSAGLSRLDLLDSNRINLPQASIFQLAIDGSSMRRVTSPPSNTFGDTLPAVSPDGQKVAFLRADELYTVAATGSKVRRLTNDKRFIYGLVWIDNREILFSSDRRGTRTLWRIAADGQSEPQPVAGIEGEGSYPTVAFSAKSPPRLAYARTTYDANIWTMQVSARRNGPARIVTTPTPVNASTRNEFSPDFSPDGKKIVFASDRSGYMEIWVSNTDGSNTAQLTTLASSRSGTPRWSPNGQSIAFDSLAAGNNDIWIVGAEGGAPKQVTTESSDDARPSWSRDGRWIYFRSNRSGAQQIWKMPSTAPYKPAIQVTRTGGFEAFESWDGKLLYYIKSAEGLWSVPVAGGTEEPVLKDVRHSYWRLAENGIYFLDFMVNTSSNLLPNPLRFFSFASHKLQPIYMIQKDINRGVPGLAVTRDGRWIAWSQIDHQESDLMLVENF